MDDAEGELADDVEHTRSDHLIERVLNEIVKPTAEEPVELGNNKEWNKHRPQEDAKRGGYNAEGHNDERQSFRDHRPKPEQGIKKRRNRLGDSRRFEIAQHILGVVGDPLRVGLPAPIRQAAPPTCTSVMQ